MQCMTALGLITGPILGSALFSLFGFKYAFIVYGSVEVLLSILVRLKLPAHSAF